MKVRAVRILIPAACLSPLLVLASVYLPFPKQRLDPAPLLSLRIEDRNGALLREVLSDRGGRCRWLGRKDISPYLIKATVAAEDRGFFLHRGVSPLSVARALVQNTRSGRVVSGASTITQQLVRNLGSGRRTLPVKVKEAWLAVRLENSVSKDDILVQYLNRIGYGNQAFGAEAAARLYFDKPASDLSPAEAAFLAVIPRSPASYDPFRHFDRVKSAQERLLDDMARLGFLTHEERDRARLERLVVRTGAEAWRAPHFCDRIWAGLDDAARRGTRTVRTSLDLVLQTKVEKLLRGGVRGLASRGVGNGAAIVVDNASGDILAWVGSVDYWDDRRSGQVNGVVAPRLPGSTIKPFTYALALEKGLTAATLLDDEDSEFDTPGGPYRPRNFDGSFHGRVRLRTALACSYNVPAVAVLETVGPDLLYRRLRALGFDGLTQGPGHYSVGLTLGNGEATLLELARAYRTLARSGLFSPTRECLGAYDKDGRALLEWSPDRSRQVFSERAATIVTDILSDNDARIPAFGRGSPLALPFPAAVKTGTSKDFRDNWAVGYTADYTVGVWIGNFDGAPLHGVSGITGCGPVFRDIMLLLHATGAPPAFPEAPGLVRVEICPASGLRPAAGCPARIEEVFIRGTEPVRVCDAHGPGRSRPDAGGPGAASRAGASLRLVFPKDGDIFKLDPTLRRSYQSITLRAAAPEEETLSDVEWWVNGRRAARSGTALVLTWNLRPGSYTIKVTAGAGHRRLESRPVTVRVLA
ncbi:MAG: penicillin-binding protein 1C [Candidatus Aminicenantes bacterium]|nr:penicillin-binding protein 1C [Candidatus Aminicenantes bacterium]